MSQACVQLVRDLYSSKGALWYDVITSDVIKRLNKLPSILERSSVSNKTSCSGTIFLVIDTVLTGTRAVATLLRCFVYFVL